MRFYDRDTEIVDLRNIEEKSKKNEALLCEEFVKQDFQWKIYKR